MTSEYLEQIQQGLNPTERLYQIVEHGMCIGCGICQSIAGPQNVEMKIVDNGYFRPVVNQPLSGSMVDKIMDICPGTRIQGLPRSQVDQRSQYDSVWGDFRELFLAYAAEPEVRHMGSTGGLLTALGLYLIESGEVDFILHACEPEDHPTFGERFISRTRADVLKASGSRYGPTATLVDVVEIIEQAANKNETLAFIGTPCDVSAFRNLERHDRRIEKCCRYFLAMVCGGFMEPASTRKFLGNLGVDYDDVSSLRYRGYGCPGPTTIKCKDGRVIEKNYLDFWGEDESAWGLPPRCKVCADGIGDATDIAAADTWIGGSPNWEDQKTDPGTNAAIVRSQRGVELMAAAIQAGYVSRGDDLTPRDMDKFQPHQEAKKRLVWARFEGMKEAGYVVPDTTDLRLQELYDENDRESNLRQTEGTRTRIEQGKFSEPAPE
jgi:coenzyme F420 hydrogenase subunit beta